MEDKPLTDEEIASRVARVFQALDGLTRNGQECILQECLDSVEVVLRSQSRDWSNSASG